MVNLNKKMHLGQHVPNSYVVYKYISKRIVTLNIIKNIKFVVYRNVGNNLYGNKIYLNILISI